MMFSRFIIVSAQLRRRARAVSKGLPIFSAFSFQVDDLVKRDGCRAALRPFSQEARFNLDVRCSEDQDMGLGLGCAHGFVNIVSPPTLLSVTHQSEALRERM